MPTEDVHRPTFTITEPEEAGARTHRPGRPLRFLDNVSRMVADVLEHPE